MMGVNAMANPKAATRAIFFNSLFIILFSFLKFLILHTTDTIRKRVVIVVVAVVNVIASGVRIDFIVVV